MPKTPEQAMKHPLRSEVINPAIVKIDRHLNAVNQRGSADAPFWTVAVPGNLTEAECEFIVREYTAVGWKYVTYKQTDERVTMTTFELGMSPGSE